MYSILLWDPILSGTIVVEWAHVKRSTVLATSVVIISDRKYQLSCPTSLHQMVVYDKIIIRIQWIRKKPTKETPYCQQEWRRRRTPCSGRAAWKGERYAVRVWPSPSPVQHYCLTEPTAACHWHWHPCLLTACLLLLPDPSFYPFLSPSSLSTSIEPILIFFTLYTFTHFTHSSHSPFLHTLTHSSHTYSSDLVYTHTYIYKPVSAWLPRDVQATHKAQ